VRNSELHLVWKYSYTAYTCIMLHQWNYPLNTWWVHSIVPISNYGFHRQIFHWSTVIHNILWGSLKSRFRWTHADRYVNIYGNGLYSNIDQMMSFIAAIIWPYFDDQWWQSKPITVAVWFKAWTVFARSNTGIVTSNPTRGMDVCVRLFCACVVLCVGSSLAMDQGVLPTVYRLRNSKSRQGPTKGCRAIVRWQSMYA
jgi:hypothetical protein